MSLNYAWKAVPVSDNINLKTSGMDCLEWRDSYSHLLFESAMVLNYSCRNSTVRNGVKQKTIVNGKFRTDANVQWQIWDNSKLLQHTQWWCLDDRKLMDDAVQSVMTRYYLHLDRQQWLWTVTDWTVRKHWYNIESTASHIIWWGHILIRHPHAYRIIQRLGHRRTSLKSSLSLTATQPEATVMTLSNFTADFHALHT